RPSSDSITWLFTRPPGSATQMVQVLVDQRARSRRRVFAPHIKMPDHLQVFGRREQQRSVGLFSTTWDGETRPRAWAAASGEKRHTTSPNSSLSIVSLEPGRA